MTRPQVVNENYSQKGPVRCSNQARHLAQSLSRAFSEQFTQRSMPDHARPCKSRFPLPLPPILGFVHCTWFNIWLGLHRVSGCFLVYALTARLDLIGEDVLTEAEHFLTDVPRFPDAPRGLPDFTPLSARRKGIYFPWCVHPVDRSQLNHRYSHMSDVMCLFSLLNAQLSPSFRTGDRC